MKQWKIRKFLETAFKLADHIDSAFGDEEGRFMAMDGMKRLRLV